jgi:alkylation response protein AidB-like acyl-CoA dehydrogenase
MAATQASHRAHTPAPTLALADPAPPRTADRRNNAVAQARRLTPVLAARAGVHDRAGSFPHDGLAHLREAGLLRLTVPDAVHPAAGLDEARAVVAAIAEGDPSVALVLAMQLVHQDGIARSATWPRGLRERVQGEAVRSGALINILRVEAELGSPARGGLPAMIATRSGEGWRLTGRKIYSTGAPGLTWGLVWARTDEAEPRVGLFLVPMAAAGLRIEESWDQMGLRASGSHSVVLDGVAVPLDHAVNLRIPAAWQVPDPAYLAWNTTLIASVYQGVARAAQAWFIAFLRDRAPSNLGSTLAGLPRFQEAVGENERLLAVSERLLAGAARDADAGRPGNRDESGFTKVSVTENAIAIVQRAVELSGNPGLSRANPLERHLRDALCGRIHTPQADSVRLAAGRAALEV